MHHGRPGGVLALPWLLLISVCLLWAAPRLSAQAASSVTTNCLTLRWLAPGDDGQFGTAAAYDIRYGESYLTDENWGQAVRVVSAPDPMPAGTLQEVRITGLVSGTTYYVGMKTADERHNWSRIYHLAIDATLANGCIGNAGNADCDPDDAVDVGDLVAVISYLYELNDDYCLCYEEANVDGSPDGVVDIGDMTMLIQYLFFDNVPPVECP